MISTQRERLGTDLTSWTIGPYHGALPGPMRIRLKLDGEVIVSGEVETGFLHRGLEKALELHPWRSGIPYADHLDPEAAVFGELLLCLAVEEIASIEVPLRAQRIRVILSELSRIASHLDYVARIAKSVGGDTALHYVLRDREKILDLFELLTGARFSLCFLRFGGVSSDVTDGFMERVLEACDLIKIRLKEYNDLFSFNHAFLKRATGIGAISKETSDQLGLSGPNARASGSTLDCRKSHPYCGYEKIDFHVPIGQGQGDVHDRFLLRLKEIAQSVEILKQSIDTVPSGAFINAEVARELKVPAGEAYVRIESARGLLAAHIVSDGSERPARVQFRVPSTNSIMAIPGLIVGARLEDLPLLLASLDIGVAEADR